MCTRHPLLKNDCRTIAGVPEYGNSVYPDFVSGSAVHTNGSTLYRPLGSQDRCLEN
jgi:hypothetical protein